MMGGAKAQYDSIKAFSETDQTDDLKRLHICRFAGNYLLEEFWSRRDLAKGAPRQRSGVPRDPMGEAHHERSSSA